MEGGSLQQLGAAVLPALEDCDGPTQELLVWALHLALMHFLECNVVRYWSPMPSCMPNDVLNRSGTHVSENFYISGACATWSAAGSGIGLSEKLYALVLAIK